MELEVWLAIMAPLSLAAAEVRVKPIQYHDQGIPLSGFLARPDGSRPGPYPGVIVFSDWMGVGGFGIERARRLAKSGYIALTADVYGAGVVPRDAPEAADLAGRFKSDRPLMRRRARAALSVLEAMPEIDPRRLAAIGFCFGGTVALELARTGAPLAGAVSFHGGLATPDPALAKNITAKLLILHGASDPLVPPAEVQAFEMEMNAAGVDWQLIKYGGAMHSFTSPAARDAAHGVAYNEAADQRSYRAMQDFFEELFGVRPPAALR